MYLAKNRHFIHCEKRHCFYIKFQLGHHYIKLPVGYQHFPRFEGGMRNVVIKFSLKSITKNVIFPYIFTGCLPCQGSQGIHFAPWKVREKSRNLVKSQGILVKPRNLFWGTANWRICTKISIHIKNFWFWEDKYREKSL